MFKLVTVWEVYGHNEEVLMFETEKLAREQTIMLEVELIEEAEVLLCEEEIEEMKEYTRSQNS